MIIGGSAPRFEAILAPDEHDFRVFLDRWYRAPLVSCVGERRPATAASKTAANAPHYSAWKPALPNLKVRQVFLDATDLIIIPLGT